MKRINRYSVVVVSFTTLLLFLAKPIGADMQSQFDYPENNVPLMKYWVSKPNIEAAKNELKRLLDIYPPDEARETYRSLYKEDWVLVPEQDLEWKEDDFFTCLRLLLYCRPYFVQINREGVYKLLEMMEDSYEIYEDILNENFVIALRNSSGWPRHLSKHYKYFKGPGGFARAGLLGTIGAVVGAFFGGVEIGQTLISLFETITGKTLGIAIYDVSHAVENETKKYTEEKLSKNAPSWELRIRTKEGTWKSYYEFYEPDISAWITFGPYRITSEWEFEPLDLSQDLIKLKVPLGR